jgi:5-methyltetrahydrofolate--homocysteine methyltransferase
VEQLQALYNAVLEGNAQTAQSEVKTALDAGVPAETILKEGLIAAMSEVGRRFEAREYFVPEMLVAARAMQFGVGVLKPHLAAGSAGAAGRIVIGTVKGDLHDIGKNLVCMMLEGAGFEVIDLGIDVAPDKFVAAVQQHQPQLGSHTGLGSHIGLPLLVGMSALLTTTMPAMTTTLQALSTAGLREHVKVMIGGAPVTENFARQIGADGYAPDASATVRLAKSLIATA